MNVKLFNELESLVSDLFYPDYFYKNSVNLFPLNNRQNSMLVRTLSTPTLKNPHIVSSNENVIIYEFNLAGFSKEQINLSYKKSDDQYYAGTFSVKAERSAGMEMPKSVKNFSYSNTVSYGYDISKMTSTFVNGLLTISIPKMEIKPKEINEIKVNIE